MRVTFVNLNPRFDKIFKIKRHIGHTNLNEYVELYKRNKLRFDDPRKRMKLSK